MAGRLFAVVGPSGAGKDTLIAAARARRPGLVVARRVITRPAEACGEPYEGVDAAEFARRSAAGGFALEWRAHGLSYGIPEAIDRALRAGRTVVFNGSRAMLGAAAERYPGLCVVHVTASIPILAARLAARGRESRGEIAERLARARYEIPAGIPVRTVINDAGLEPAVEAFLAALAPD